MLSNSLIISIQRVEQAVLEKNTNSSILSIKELYLRFGGLEAIGNLSLEINKGEILALIGPNGAGKTCVLNCINGFYRPQSGKVFFSNKEITRLPSHKIAELGISRTFQNVKLYTGLTTLDNLMAGRHVKIKDNVLSAAIHFGWTHREEIKHREAVERVIDLLEIESVRKKVVGTLPYGLRKRVELGRALAQEPQLLLLDEPMAGMNLEEKEDMARFVLDVQDEWGCTIVLVEHDMGVVMDIADRVVVMNFGQKIAEGVPHEIEANPEVIRAYLGGESK